MDFLIINSPVSLDIALLLREVLTHLTSAFTPSEHFENFNSSLAFQSFNNITRNIESIHYKKKKTIKKPKTLVINVKNSR